MSRMMRAAIPETWSVRRAADEARHLASCLVCREKLRPREDQKLYLVKNARTREARHVLINGQDFAETVGWPEHEILYSLLIEDGTKKAPPMTEDAKARLRTAAAERKLKKALRANTPVQPEEGGKKEKEEKSMAKKVKKPKSKKLTRTDGNFETRLPAEFVRRYKGVDYKVAKVGDGWQVDGSKTMTIHDAMVHIVEKHQPINEAWKASGFFLIRK